MINLTLKQLRYFEALARHGHFGRAAEACAISQPALSMQIRELEEALGTELFERGARQVRLTWFGERVRRPRPRHPARRWTNWAIWRAPRATGWWGGCGSG